METKYLVHAALSAAAIASAPAGAQGLYAELGAGRSQARVDCAGTTTCDRNDTFVRGIIGYEFTPYWAAELTVASLGRTKASGTVPGVGLVQASARLRSVGVGVAGTWPLSDALSLTGRLGVASNQTSVSGSTAGVSVSDNERKTAAYGGLALNCALSKAVSLGLTLDRTDAEYDNEKTPVVAWGLGVRYRF